MKKITKISLFISAMLIVALVYPLFKNPSNKDVTTASDEIRVTKGNEVKHPALGRDYIAWMEYRNGAYNIYTYNFFVRKDVKLNTDAVSVDTIGPVVFGDQVYWVDHSTSGWDFYDADLTSNSLRKIYTESHQVISLDAYENRLVYEAKNGNSSDAFVLNKNKIPAEVKNISNDDTYQRSPSVFGDYAAWAEFSFTCDNAGSSTQTCSASKYGRVVLYHIPSGAKTIIKDNAENLSNVQIRYGSLTWSELEAAINVVKVYEIKSGTSKVLSPADSHSSDPVMSADVLLYFVKRNGGTDLEMYRFSTGQRSTLGWTKTDKKFIALGPSADLAAWVDNRMGSYDLYYFDAAAPTPYSAATPANIDQDHDGLTDAEEAKLGTNPYDADTDHDGLTDSEEVKRYHTYSTQYDSDGDGISDGDEINYWLSNPLSFDSNNDGIDDKTSIVQGYNPMAERSTLTAYRVPRMDNLNEEKKLSAYLKSALDHYLGRGRWHTKNSAEWNKVVNSYIYGGYNIKEIGAYVRGDKNAISFEKLATVLREETAIAQGDTVYSAIK